MQAFSYIVKLHAIEPLVLTLCPNRLADSNLALTSANDFLHFRHLSVFQLRFRYVLTISQPRLFVKYQFLDSSEVP